MFWKKKKPKRKQPVKKQIPKHIADNLKYGESVAEGFKKGVSEDSEKLALYRIRWIKTTSTRERRYICGLSKDTTNRNSRCFPNLLHIR